MSTANNDCFVVDGKLALPYQYFAGQNRKPIYYQPSG